MRPLPPHLEEHTFVVHVAGEIDAEGVQWCVRCKGCLAVTGGPGGWSFEEYELVPYMAGPDGRLKGVVAMNPRLLEWADLCTRKDPGEDE